MVMTKKKQILTLIEADILNAKLVYTLNGIGIDAGDYLADTSLVIFRLMGIKKERRTEILYHKYFDLVRQVEYLDLRVADEKARLSEKIYRTLRLEV